MKTISAAAFTAGRSTRRDLSGTTPRDWTLSSTHDSPSNGHNRDHRVGVHVHSFAEF